MKKLLTFSLGLCLILGAQQSKAQVFTVAHDTVYLAPPLSLTTVTDEITVLGSSPVLIRWQVDTSLSDFPYDWMYNAAGGTSFCDNAGCYSSSIDTDGTIESASYSASSTNFHMNIDLLGAANTTTPHHITVKFMVLGQTSYETFFVTPPTSINKTRKNEDVTLYPNPATNTVNVVYDASLEVKNVAIYNLIGKLVSIYKVNGNSASMGIENLNSGIYFLRLINNAGEVVQTKKFTKQ